MIFGLASKGRSATANGTTESVQAFVCNAESSCEESLNEPRSGDRV